MKALVAKKQLEFTNAGWCMNDEATTSYTDIIDQMTLGKSVYDFRLLFVCLFFNSIFR